MKKLTWSDIIGRKREFDEAFNQDRKIFLEILIKAEKEGKIALNPPSEDEKMKILLTITGTELKIKKAIAKGWNIKYNEELTHKDIGTLDNKEDIVCAIPYLDLDQITIKKGK